MKASIFLKLVGEMLTVQQDYFKIKRTGSKADAMDMLIKAKALEKQVAAVVKDGFLEPDEPTLVKLNEEEYETQMELGEMRFPDEPDAGDLLDAVTV